MAVGFPTKVDYNTGDVLSAQNMNDLSGTVNLLESAQYAAGKNYLINGDFDINQRGFTSATASGTYGFDRFQLGAVDGTVTYTPQTFTLGSAPVAGYESTNYAQVDVTGQTLNTAQATLSQRIESVRTLAGQTATFSFWAKANSGTPNLNVVMRQVFGTGGSPSAAVNTAGTAQTITTSWARYSFTIAVPSISGKTLGTTSGTDYLSAAIWFSSGSTQAAPTVGLQTNTFQIWGVQVEKSSTASPFQTATGTKQGELAACQRYFWRPVTGTGNYVATGQNYATTNALAVIQYPVTMRRTPSITVSAAAHFSQSDATAGARVLSAFSADSFTRSTARLTTTCGAFMTAGHATLINSTDALATLDFGAEL
jgi:hypothetical protein